MSARGRRGRNRRLDDIGVRRWRTYATASAARDVECVHPVMRANRVARRRLRRGAVVLARVPFDSDHAQEAEHPGAKYRPVVVVRLEGDVCVCLPCTSADSRLRRPWLYTEMRDLEPAGLTRATGVRRRELRLPVEDCVAVHGALSDRDRARVLGDSPALACARPPAREPAA